MAARLLSRAVVAGGVILLGACALVGPDYEQPESPLAPSWYEAEKAGVHTTPEQRQLWWESLQDPVLNQLILIAREANNSLEIAGLRVLEARAQLAVAGGSLYPQTQLGSGGVSAIGASKNAANTAAGDLRYTQYDIGIGAAWEIDFWGKYRRGIEAADASYLGSVAAYDQAMVLITGQVGFTYLAIRSLEAQLDIAHDNIATQQRSYDIVDVQYRNGNSAELDVLQARTLLLSTQSTVPSLEAQLRQAKHALSVLLGQPPGSTEALLGKSSGIPSPPTALAIGLPAELLRQRPDVRQAEYLAMAQNASVGSATANLYPSFSITGSLGLVAAGNTNTTQSGNSGAGQLFSADSLSYSIGPSFVWPFFNYGRIKNNIRVQDARLQQALVAYRETVIQAAREVEDAVVALDGARQQDTLLAETVTVAKRATDVALLRFREGFADYQRVLDAQQTLFTQQGRFVSNQSALTNSYISLYVALGGGWHTDHPRQLIREDTRKTMRERSNWGKLIEVPEDSVPTPESQPQ